jgi:uncharacterized protein involved in outer membrane biogenesis
VRILVAIAVLLAGALMGGLALLPRLVDWNDYREELTRQAEAITGQTVGIAGRIDLELLPRPTLTLARATLTSPPEGASGPSQGSAPAGRSLVVDRLDLRLKPLPLLRGRLDVESARLVRPVLRIEAPDASRAGALLLAGSGLLLPLGHSGPSRVTVIDGRALVAGAGRPAAEAIEAINFEVGADGPNGPYALDGDFAIAGQRFGVTGRLGQLHPGSWSTLQLMMTAPETGSEPTVLSFRGLAWSDLAAPRLRGDLSVTGRSAAGGLDALGRVLDGGPAGGRPALPGWLTAPFRLAGHLEFADREGRLEQLQVALAATEATGSLAIALRGPRPEIDLELNLPHFAVSHLSPEDAAGLVPLAALAALKGRIALSVQAVDYRGGTIRQLRSTLALTGGGQITVEQARATLPGQTSVDFTGALAVRGADALLEGALTVVSGDLGGLLAWPGLAPQGLPPGRLQTLSLDSRVTLDASAVRFTQAELRVDASRLSGSLAFSMGVRPQIAGALSLDRLNLDAYLPDGEMAPLLERGLAVFGGIDAALEARVERLTWRGFRLQEIALDGRSVGGQLTLKHLSLHDDEDTKAELSGAVDLGRKTFDLAGAVQSARPLPLLRGLGVTLPVMLARLAPVSLSGSAKGSPDAFELALELHHADARLALEGEVRSPAAGPLTYALAVDGSDPDYRRLLDDLGIVAAPAGHGPAPVELNTRVSGDLTGKTAVVGSAQLGAMSLTGQIDWQPGTPRPKLAVKLSAGDPDADDLAGLVAMAGLRPEPILSQGLQGGAWSTQPLAFGYLTDADAEVELSAKGGLAGPGVELRARLDQGRLMVDRFSATLWNGQLSAQLSLDAARPLPFMGLALDLHGVDAKALAAWAGLPLAVEGAADLYVEATSVGDNPRDLVRGLTGDAKVGLHDGRLAGADLARLAAAPASGPGFDGAPSEPAPAVPVPTVSGSFGLKRGIASAQEVRLKLGDTPVNLEGTVDFLLWAADLTLSAVPAGGSDEGAASLRIVGPLDRPQLRLRKPAPPAQPAPAP